jgi:hypothetical protein
VSLRSVSPIFALLVHSIGDTRRLIDLVAEDNAIEDTIYHLHRGLNAGRIDLDRFIKVDQFFESNGLLNLISL